ncbi:helix-turn-helix domain-containing protein [Streptomyces sp. NPDC059071]|uniref:helix-turn-helix domain-containing protein n=1 Tax=unclassified Streptomyces TaxID=2593676 RepID=UPI0036601A99
MSELPVDGPEELVELVGHLRDLRARARQPLTRIAARAGMAKSSVYHVFSGKRLPSLENLMVIVDTLHREMWAEVRPAERRIWVELWQRADAAVRARRADEAAAAALRGAAGTSSNSELLAKSREDERRMLQIEALLARQAAEAAAAARPDGAGASPDASMDTTDGTVSPAVPHPGRSAELKSEDAVPPGPSTELVLARDSSVSSALVVTGLRALRQQADAAKAAALEAQRQASELEARIAALETQIQEQNRRIKALLAEIPLADGERNEGE